MNPSINLIFFGSFRDSFGFSQKEVNFVDIESLKAWMIQQKPEIAEMDFLIAVNQEVVKGNTVFAEGDEVAVMSPFAGG